VVVDVVALLLTEETIHLLKNMLKVLLQTIKIAKEAIINLITEAEAVDEDTTEVERGGSRGGRGGFRRPSYNNNAPRTPNPNRIESPTSLFVANLPYSFTDDDLKALLPKATRATVAKNYQGKSKGFGFIEFANVEEQQAAFALGSDLKAEDRELIVKIALVSEERRTDSSVQTQEATA